MADQLRYSSRTKRRRSGGKIDPCGLSRNPGGSYWFHLTYAQVLKDADEPKRETHLGTPKILR